MKTHWLPPFLLSFAFMRFSCFLATESRQNCGGSDGNVENTDHPDALLPPGNAKKHKKNTFFLKTSSFSKTLRGSFPRADFFPFFWFWAGDLEDPQNQETLV